MDVLNIVMIRRRIELEVKRLSEQQEKMQKKSSWLGSWFGGSSAKKEDDLTNATAICKFSCIFKKKIHHAFLAKTFDFEDDFY